MTARVTAAEAHALADERGAMGAIAREVAALTGERDALSAELTRRAAREAVDLTALRYALDHAMDQEHRRELAGAIDRHESGSGAHGLHLIVALRRGGELRAHCSAMATAAGAKSWNEAPEVVASARQRADVAEGQLAGLRAAVRAEREAVRAQDTATQEESAEREAWSALNMRGRLVEADCAAGARAWDKAHDRALTARTARERATADVHTALDALLSDGGGR